MGIHTDKHPFQSYVRKKSYRVKVSFSSPRPCNRPYLAYGRRQQELSHWVHGPGSVVARHDCVSGRNDVGPSSRWGGQFGFQGWVVPRN